MTSCLFHGCESSASLPLADRFEGIDQHDDIERQVVKMNAELSKKRSKALRKKAEILEEAETKDLQLVFEKGVYRFLPDYDMQLPAHRG